MKTSQLKLMSVSDLEKKLLELRKELLNLRFQRASGQLQSTAGFRAARRDIARIKTLLTNSANAQNSNVKGENNAS